MLAQNTQPPESGVGLDWQHAACAACRSNVCLTVKQCIRQPTPEASLAQLAEHALRKRMVAGSIPAGGFVPAGCPLAAQEMCFWLVNIQRRRANVPTTRLHARPRLPSQPQLLPLPLLPLPQLPLLPAQQ